MAADTTSPDEAGGEDEVSSNIRSDVVQSAYKPPSLLPIAKYRDVLLYTVETWPVTVLVGETGSGKTTQLPQYLYDAGWCQNGAVIAVTQPRRVAATSIAARVAQEVGCELGDKVGYSIRFEDRTSEHTRIKFLTDGVLLREALVDPLLSRYSVIMVDEAHERTMSTDLLLGILRKIRKKRPQLRIIISSATLNAQQFFDFFSEDPEESNKDHTTKICVLPGRTYPIDTFYLKEPAEQYVRQAVQTVIDIHSKEPKGDILVFLTGREEIDEAVQEINDYASDIHPSNQQLLVRPLYAGLPVDQQMEVFEPPPDNTRKVVVATNIAEASVTIDGIVYVVDCGFVKMRVFDAASGIEYLTASPTSKAAADQRAGRAGRTKPGKCYRLYQESDYQRMLPQTPPEILRSNLAPLLLTMKSLGIDNFTRFRYLTAPPASLIRRAVEELHSLGALDDRAKLTRPLGDRMALLPLPPRLARALLAAAPLACVHDMLSIAAMATLQGAVWAGGRSAWEAARHKFAATEGDHLLLLNIFAAFTASKARQADPRWARANSLNYQSLLQAVRVRAQLRRYLANFNIAEGSSLLPLHAPDAHKSAAAGELLRKCVLTGFFAHAARMQPDGSFRPAAGGTMALFAHPTSILFNRKVDWVVFQEVLQTRQKIYIRDLSVVQRDWLVQAAPEFYKLEGPASS